jgi:hypothetical protein
MITNQLKREMEEAAEIIGTMEVELGNEMYINLRYLFYQ